MKIERIFDTDFGPCLNCGIRVKVTHDIDWSKHSRYVRNIKIGSLLIIVLSMINVLIHYLTGENAGLGIFAFVIGIVLFLYAMFGFQAIVFESRNETVIRDCEEKDKQEGSF